MGGARAVFRRPLEVAVRHVVAVALLGMSWSCADGPSTSGEPPRFVAHAGGIGNHRVYTNSREALEHSVSRGFELIEIDLSWTTDERLVLVHDWDREFARVFNLPPRRLSFEEFRAARSAIGISQMVLDDIGPFLAANPEISLVTDFKERSVDGLRRIARRFAELRHRFVPQIYHPGELREARTLGFDRIIFTLYQSDLSDREIVDIAAAGELWAITMPVRRALNGELAGRLDEIGVPVFAHTVNDRLTMDALRAAGVHGIYTDWLSPSDEALTQEASSWTENVDDPLPLEFAVVPFVPWAIDGLRLTLECRNEGAKSATIRIRAFDASGESLAVEDFDLAAGGQKQLDLAKLELREAAQGWLRVEGERSTKLALRRQFRDDEEQTLPIDRRAYRRFRSRGSGSRVSGLLLSLVNPTETGQTYRLRRQIGGEVIDDETTELAPNRMLIRVYRSSTSEQMEVVVDGGPMVAQTMRWDPLIRKLW